jgi:hypothetical protein
MCLLLFFYILIYSSTSSGFEYSVSNGKEVYMDELQVIKTCCNNPEVYTDEFKTSIPCTNANAQAQRCLREKAQEISSGSFNQKGERFLKELPPVARQFLIDRCGINNLVFQSTKETSCARRVLTGGDNPADEHFDFISEIASHAVETKKPVNINFEAAQSALNNYLHEYNAISILRAACSKTLSPGENQGEKCGRHELNFSGSDVPFSPTPEVSRNNEAVDLMEGRPSKLPDSFSGIDSIDGPIRERIEAQADQKKRLEDQALKEGVGGQFKCGETLLKVDDENPLCLDWKNSTQPVSVTTQNELDRIGEHVFYRDLAAFAANKVWPAYALGAISDPSFSNRECPEGNREDVVKNDLLEVIKNDYPMGKTKLTRCMTPRGLIERGEVQAAVGAGVKVRCENMSEGVGGCSDTALTLTKEQQRKKEVERFKKRFFQLKEVKGQLSKLKAGRLKIPGKSFGCSERFSSCEEFFNHQANCEQRFSSEEFNNGRALISGCISSDIMQDPYKSTFRMYQNLKELENYILSKNPALAARVNDGDEEKFFYETLEDKKETDQDWGQHYDLGHDQSRKKSLEFLLGTICDDPKDFAEKMLLKNPALINEYLQKHNSSHLKNLMCHMKARVNKKQQLNQAFQIGAVGATVLLGLAAAIPTGGTSLAWGLGTAATIGGLGIAGHTLYEAKQNYQMEVGMLHGCIGDFNRMQEAEDAIDDAMIAAALELAIPIGLFTGLKMAQKIKRLSQIRAQAGLRSGLDPNFGAHLDKAADIEKQISRGQQQLIARNYNLGEDVSTDVIASIHKLEQKGFSPSQIKQMIRGNCPL